MGLCEMNMMIIQIPTPFIMEGGTVYTEFFTRVVRVLLI